MNIFILGATGRVGSHILAHLLQDGHTVTALVRNPDKIQGKHDNLTIIKGGVLNQEDIIRGMNNVEVVISALSTDKTSVLSDSVRLIIESMEIKGVKRIITIGTAGILDSRAEPGLFRYQSNESKRKLTRASEEHRTFYENLQHSSLDWTIVCPTYLPDEGYTGEYRVERNVLPKDGVKVSVQDTAEFAYHQITSTEYIKTRVGIAY